ncbi:MAG: nucleotidyl transferase AbiEii/AbiGii toxin family protein [Proteobacteria bacterium]|nr:nucleotidyl transferase AbiEii/AbiGii toxin family protein [Pseudomonadota bacterium]
MKKPSNEMLQGISEELNVSPDFIAKDWYINEVLKTFNKITENNPHITCAFGGGTSLSKAHKIIKRFSEDVDFKIVSTKELTRTQRRNLMREIVDTFDKNEILGIKDINKHNNHKLLDFNLDYPKTVEEDLNTVLRPSIKVEISFDKNILPCEEKNIQTIVHEQTKSDFSLKVPCISALETSVNKVSALMWRLSPRS